MVSRREVEERIKETLFALKRRLEENIRNNKALWSDDSFGEGLQIRCEGLEAFLIPCLAWTPVHKPEDISNYLPIKTLKDEVNSVHKTVIEEGFVSTPYLYDRLEQEGIHPAEFIDTVSYALTAMIHAREILLQTGELDADTDKKIIEVVNKGLKWMIDNHIPNGGWSGFPFKTVTHVYSTWTAVECLWEIERLVSRGAPDDTNRLFEEFKKCCLESKNWIVGFAKKQREIWVSDDGDLPTTGVIYNIYGLATLLALDVEEEYPDIILKEIKSIIKRWRRRKEEFQRSTFHYFYLKREGSSELLEIDYEDESILILAISALSEAATALKDRLPTEKLSSTESLDNAVSRTLSEMFEALYDRFYKNGLWTDASGRFSIYMTERVLEALLAYAEYLGPPPMDLTQIGEKINTVIEAVGKVSRSGDEILGRLDALDRRMSSIEAAVNEIKELFSKLEAKIVDKIVERARSGSEEIEAIERVKKHAPKRK